FNARTLPSLLPGTDAMIAPAVRHRSPAPPSALRRHGDRFTDPIRGLETRGHDYRRSSRPAARPEGGGGAISGHDPGARRRPRVAPRATGARRGGDGDP